MSPSTHSRPNHARGKFVVIVIFALGLTLGFIAFLMRNSIPKLPATQPSTFPLRGSSTNAG